VAVIAVVTVGILLALGYILSPPGLAPWIALTNRGLGFAALAVLMMLLLGSERKRIMMQHSEERFRSLIEATAQIVWTTPPAENSSANHRSGVASRDKPPMNSKAWAG
jgi:hypothetical protein